MTAGAGRRLAGLVALTGLVLTPLLFSGGAPGAEIGFTPVELRVVPIERFELGSAATEFGALQFRGGLEISGRDADFGALSGIDFMPDGTLLAVADTGFWFSARPVESEGRLTGLLDGRMARILNKAGRPVASKTQGDAEGLRIAARGGQLEALVSFEQRNDVRRFAVTPDLARALPESVRLPKWVSGISFNGGLEAVAIAPEDGPFSGAIALVTEHSLDKAHNHRGWIIGGRRAGAFSVRRSDEFDITDAAFLPNSDLLLLERRFSFSTGVGMRIRRIAAADLRPGATVEGRVLIEADMRFQIDNMEGMAVRPGPNGETLITLLSDDNQSMLQRTILLQFALAPDPPPAPRPRPEPVSASSK
jgi:hypothetical protein